MRLPFIGLLLAAIIAIPVGGASAANARQERVYFECSEARIANFEAQPAGWSTTAPPLRLAEGGGCVQGDAAGTSTSAGPITLTTGRFAGSFSGNLHSLNVRLDTISVGSAQTGAPVVFDVTLLVDGRDALGGARRLEVQPIPAAGTNDRVHTYFFSVVNLPFTELADDRIHSVEFTAEPVNQPVVGWAYGAKEVPSGLEFNPNGLHPYRIQPTS